MKPVWKEHYAMGVEQLDRDHRQLFQIAGKIIDTVEHTDGRDPQARLFVIREGVKYLQNYFEEHSTREEAYMRQIHYRDYVAHKYLHDEFQSVQMSRFQRIVDRGTCSRDEIFDFVGLGIGWLLEHISTVDMAIVGKGIMSHPKPSFLTREVLEQELGMMFTSTLNIDISPRLINGSYSGEPCCNMVTQMLTFRRSGESEPLVVIAGIEQSFLTRVAQMVYGEDVGQAEALIFATLEIFGASFWRTLGMRLLQSGKDVEYLGNHFLTRAQVQEHFEKQIPPVSALFDSSWGKFFVASFDPSWYNMPIAL